MTKHERMLTMKTKLNLRTEVSSEELLEAMREVHQLSEARIEELFGISRKFQSRSGLIAYVVRSFNAEEIVSIIENWQETRDFHKDDIVMNYGSRKLYVVTNINEYNITLLDVDGEAYEHPVVGFEKWFTKTGGKCKINKTINKALKQEEE